MRAETVKLLWKWDPERITNLTRQCIKSAPTPKAGRQPRGSSYQSQENRTTGKCRTHRVIALLDSLGKLAEKTAVHLIADQLERGRKLHEDQYECR